MSSTKRSASEVSPSSVIGGWTIGPAENFTSDWVITVVNTDDSDKETSYHVHKNNLACGANKSEYFACLLDCKGLKESIKGVTRIELEGKVAMAFPVMLDFLYSGKLIDVSSEHIVPLFWLADYFVIDSLQKPLKGLRKKSLVRDVVILYKDAVALGHDETLDAIVHFVNGYSFTYFKYFDKSLLFMKTISPDFFLRLIQPKEGISIRSWDHVALTYVLHHASQVDKINFSKLSEKLFPSHKPFDVHDIDKVVELFDACPKVEELPLEVQKQVVESVVNVSRKVLPLESKLQHVWRVVDVTKNIADINDRLLSTLHSSLDQFFTNHPAALESLQDDKIELLHELLSANTMSKLFATLQKQCMVHKTEIARLKERHERELRNFQRFNAEHIQCKILLSYNRCSGTPRPGLTPRHLPPGETSEEGWMYRDRVGGIPRPLYTYER